MPKKRKVQKSLLANSLLLPQHRHHCHLYHLEEALLSHLPLGDLSSPKAAGEPRSLKKRSGHVILGPPWKGMILKTDSRPSSLERRIVALASCASRTPLRTSQPVSSSQPPTSSLGRLCRGTRCWPLCTNRTSHHHLRPADAQAPKKDGLLSPACLQLKSRKQNK